MSLVDEGNRSKNKAVCVSVYEKRPFSFAESHRAAWRTCKSFLFGVSALFGGECTKIAQQPIRFIVICPYSRRRSNEEWCVVSECPSFISAAVWMSVHVQ